MIRSGKGVWNSIVCEVTQSYPTLCDPMDCSLPGSLVRGIFQARVLEWVAISFSRGDLPNPGIKPRSPTLQADALASEPPGKPIVYGLNENYLLFHVRSDRIGWPKVISHSMYELGISPNRFQTITWLTYFYWWFLRINQFNSDPYASFSYISFYFPGLLLPHTWIKSIILYLVFLLSSSSSSS